MVDGTEVVYQTKTRNNDGAPFYATYRAKATKEMERKGKNFVIADGMRLYVHKAPSETHVLQ